MLDAYGVWKSADEVEPHWGLFQDIGLEWLEAPLPMDDLEGYARLSGLPPDDCYPSPPGSATGWQNAALEEKAFVAEFPASGVTDAEARQHAEALFDIAVPGPN